VIALPDPERCPHCASRDIHVVNSRLHGAEAGCVRRVRERECRGCWHRWKTYESTLDPQVVQQRPKPAA
jgi:transcriptional regulator NrdR family protein